jgi:hypothetical protein
MRAIVLKNHYGATAARAQIVMTEIEDRGVWWHRPQPLRGRNQRGGCARLAQVDGRRGRFVWLPTFDAENQVHFSKGSPICGRGPGRQTRGGTCEVFQLIARQI